MSPPAATIRFASVNPTSNIGAADHCEKGEERVIFSSRLCFSFFLEEYNRPSLIATAQDKDGIATSPCLDN
jgi:hypothetical protein